jgi:hypothetical protein
VAAGGESFEPVDVNVLAGDGQPVAGGMGLDSRAVTGFETAPQARHQRLQGVRGIGGWSLTPEAVDQRVDGYDLARLERQTGQQHAQPGAAEVDRGSVLGDEP